MIHFIEDTHQYFDEDKELISVTTLLAKHGLAPNYSGVSPEVLKKAAERGKVVHKEIEEFVKYGEIGFTSELGQFIDFYINNVREGTAESEFIVYNDVCAGTVDLKYITNDGLFILEDEKTTYVLHKDAVSWQLSVYNAMMGYKADKLVARHFHNGMKEVEIPFKPKEEIERLFECERNGELYRPLEIADNAQMADLMAAQQYLQEIESAKKDAEAKLEHIKTVIMDKMQQNAIKSYENDYLRITYVEPKPRISIDTKRLEAEMPEIAEKYKKESKVKPSLRITIKKEDDDE